MRVLQAGGQRSQSGSLDESSGRRGAVRGSIVDGRFRTNPDYALVSFDRLPDEQREVLQNLTSDPNFYGILCPRSNSLPGIKTVDRETALLCFTLQVPGKLPGYVRHALGDRCPEAVAEYVLDGVLEIERDGLFLSGADAYEAMFTIEPPKEAKGAIAALSLDALRYAQKLAIEDPQRLSSRLYCYNRVPASPAWRRRFPTEEAVRTELGLQPGGPLHALLEQEWSEVTAATPEDAWLRFESRRRQLTSYQSRPAYKLYISPKSEHLREACQGTLEALAGSRATHFKIGRTVYGLLRPDKLIAYFESFDEVAGAAERLRRRLEGCPAQGVPFTAEIAGNGLLSWGIDPPPDEQLLEWQARESWRLWVTNRLARALMTGKLSNTATVEPWQFALERVRLEGVDPETWIPTHLLWHDQVQV